MKREGREINPKLCKLESQEPRANFIWSREYFESSENKEVIAALWAQECSDSEDILILAR